MKREELKKLVSSVLNVQGCSASVDVWHPSIKDIKFLLKLGHDKVEANNLSESCTIFEVMFDNYSYTKAPAFKFTIFCEEKEAKFMRDYIKKRKEVKI